MPDNFVGEVQMFAGKSVPDGWLKCDGSVYKVSEYAALFELIGTVYGGNGQTTFAVPNLSGRVALGEGEGPGLTNHPLGQHAGADSFSMSQSQMPSHRHEVKATTSTANSGSPSDAHLALHAFDAYATEAVDDVTMDADMLASTGGGKPISVMQPYLCLNFCIATEGVVPG